MKKMKNLKKSMTLALAASMFVSTPIVALAEGEATTNITIESTVSEDSVYSAFRILNATNAGDGYSYSLNDKYTQALKEVTGKQTETEIIDYIAGLDATGIRDFADAMWKKVEYMGADATSVDNVFSSVEQGYYLIAETTVGTAPDVKSLIMLDTLGEEDITVKTKESIPEIEKKVQETNDSTNSTDWQDGADYDIGDSVPFQLVGTVSSEIDEFGVYRYVMHDKLSSGLTYNNDIKVYLVNGEERTDVTEVVNKTAANGDSITVEFWDMNAMETQYNWTINADTKVIAEYTATLNDNAVIGSEGNTNTANIEFSNDPYVGWTTSTTPDDKVIVFTYQTIVNKVDKDGNALKGAGFTLYKYDFDVQDYVAVGTEMIGEDMTTFEFKGLDAGQYKLVETTVPDGYNKADDVVFTIEAEYDTESEDPKFIELSVNDEATAAFTADNTAGSLTTDVENLTGAELPETGGIGTTLFYIIGGTCAGLAVVLMVTKRRMSKES